MITQIIRGCGKARDVFPAIKRVCIKNKWITVKELEDIKKETKYND